ncbi:MAG: hypothetical protein DLM57_08105 [Pseudonocardiales bacterium]|nr:MAG: hypothetical protein DLM57_08105 [Pseudonocardiales bacterium]
MTARSDWHEYQLGDLITFSNGINADKSAYGRGVPFINVLEVITNEWLRAKDIPGRVTLPNKVFARYRVRRGDILFNRTSETQDEVGLASVYLDDSPVAFGGFVLRGIPTTTLLDIDYSKYVLRASDVRQQIVARGQGGIRANIGQRDLRSVTIRVPDKPEQRAIAEIIDDVSALISGLKRQTAKKRAIRQGMMQRTFTVPADHDQRAALGTLVGLLSGGTPDRSNRAFWLGSIPWISATSLKGIEVATSAQLVTSGAVRAGSKVAPLNSTLVLVRGSALHSEIRASLVTALVCFNQDVKALVPAASIEPKFLTYSIHANASRLLRLVTSAGNTAGVLDTKALKNFEIWLPSLERQRAVVSIFDDVTAELDCLSTRLVKARAVKTGMMQQLLSGGVRLPVKASL